MQEKEQLMISTHMEQLPEDVQMKFLQAYERLSRQDKDVMLMELQAMYPEFRDQNQSSPQMKFGGSLLDMEKPKYKDGGEKDPYRTYHGEDGKKKLQRELLSLGYTELGKADGKLGTKTGRAVQRFQEEQGLSGQEGIAGPETLNRLRQVLASPQAVASARTGRSPQAITSPEVKKTPGEYDPYEDMGNGMLGWQARMVGNDEERLRDIDYKEKRMTYNMERDLADGPVSSLQYNDEGKVAYLQDQKRIRAKYKDGFDSLNKEKDEIARGEGWKWKAREIKEMNKDLKSYDENFERTQDSIQESRGRERIGLGPVYPPLDPLAFKVPDPFGGQYTPDPNNPLLPGDDFMKRTPNYNAPNYNAAAPAPSGDLYGRNWFEKMDNDISSALKSLTPEEIGKYGVTPATTASSAAYLMPGPWQTKALAAAAAGIGSIGEEAIFGTDVIDTALGLTALGKGSGIGKGIKKGMAKRKEKAKYNALFQAEGLNPGLGLRFREAKQNLSKSAYLKYETLMSKLGRTLVDETPVTLNYLDDTVRELSKLPAHKQVNSIRKEIKRVKAFTTSKDAKQAKQAELLTQKLKDLEKALNRKTPLYRFGGKK